MAFVVRDHLIGRLDSWLDQLRAGLRPPIRIPAPEGGFHWEYPDHSAEVVQVAKAVRSVSALRAAAHLVNLGFTTEAASLLRTVSDFCDEIMYLGEGLLSGQLTPDQQRFVDQHFSRLPSTPEELAAQERMQYVGRKDISKALGRLATRAGGDGGQHRKLQAYLQKGYDGFVHGHHASAMELFTGNGMRFMLSGHDSERHRCASGVAVAGKLMEVLNSFDLMAMTRGLTEVSTELRKAKRQPTASGEDGMEMCRHL